MTKKEIENFLIDKGDFVQIDYLSRFIEDKSIPIDKKKFVYQKLAEIYEKKKMFRESAKMYNNLSINSIAFSEKIKNHIKETEFCVKAGDFEAADEAMRKAMNNANSTEKQNIYLIIKEFYKKQGETYERNMKHRHAVQIYEKIYRMKLLDSEKQEIKQKLMNLYERLGRLKEYFALKEKN